ncbi:inosine-5-monophosphate dehydrogenase [Halobacteriales archaeon QH_10_67_22]|nr:MAG: inosine-5-monophosphate dehydrogenase [Halobacteriales archaeon QH_10_67_22]
MNDAVTVQEVMDREFVGVTESDEVAETAELMLSEGRESVVVLRGSEPVGVMSQRDALAALIRDNGDASVGHAMTSTVPTVSPAATISEAADEMSTLGTQRLVVTDGEEAVGLVNEHDLITTSPFDPETDLTAEPETAVVGQPDERAGDAGTAGGGFEDQSICEACGALARDLTTFNGQLLCADCRDL